MAPVIAEVFYTDAVPDALATAFARGKPESDGPPTKRRKLASAPQSLAELNGVTEKKEPLGYIPLVRFNLYLEFAQTSPSFNESSNYVETLSDLPILIRDARIHKPFRRASQAGALGGCSKVALVTPNNDKTLLEVACTDPKIIEFGENLKLAAGLACADRILRTIPPVCYQSRLRRLDDGKSFRLETVILWKDSLDILDYKKLQDGPLKVFSKYILREPEFVNSNQKRRTPGKSAGWHPRDFYENVHVPEDTPSSSAEVKCNMIQCELFPFQRRAVRWLLQREGMKLQPSGEVVPVKQEPIDSLPMSFQRFEDADGRVCFASQLFMVVTSDVSNWYDAGNHLKGGVLAEEMGLGKTVELISLMCLNRRLLTPEETFAKNPDGLRPSGATLIITPPAILEQWEQEIKLHAPGLSVLHYTGIQRHQELSDQEIVELLADHDVVLTTYNVLAREVHYSGDAPKKNLRHEKKYEARKTPLVKISWWRVCLDEAQMIESGVSNAAKVARLIPRRNAWAVTGTPLRKDITDLLGLLMFLHYDPFCGFIWHTLCVDFTSVLAKIVNTIALRHSKDRVRDEIQLPAQKRLVITIPFTAVEEQHYNQQFEQMCEDCGFDLFGAPTRDDWNPDDPSVIEKMRSWLVRLRLTCLHPTGNYRRGFGAGGPLRSVAEVLEQMIDQNDALIYGEERTVLLSQLRRGQLLENAMHRQQALDLWMASLKRAVAIVKECRERLESERKKIKTTTDTPEKDVGSADTSDNEGEDADKNPRVGAMRQRLRSALEVEHICVFFTGNAYYQIKTDPKLTEPESEQFAALEKLEVGAYEKAKIIRKELLTDISRKAGRLMKVIREKNKHKQFVKIVKMKPQLYNKGLESRRVLDEFEEFCETMNKHAEQYDEWRQIMVKLLSQSLIDQEDESELEGDEYEQSTKQQDEMYVYMEALRAMFADRHDALTGQRNILIAHEVKTGIVQAKKGEGPSPKLFLEVMDIRSQLKSDAGRSLRAIITELRSLATSLEWQANEGSARARAELEIVTLVIQNAAHIASEQGKIASNLEREVEMFRDTMNNRLAYYRQLQQISDTVAPYDEESVGKPLDQALFDSKLRQEETLDEKISALKAKRRYLIHLRDESGSDDVSRTCVICQSIFEIGVLTVCGHKYCKDCLRMWWNQHRNCPTCKKRLKGNDFHQITYKPQEFVVQVEKTPTKIETERSSKNLIYADISSGTMAEIKNIDLDSSFGTKIDMLARHILWLREHDPGAKSVVFSQYKSFLTYLRVAFSKFKIGFSSVDSNDGIHNFKSDPSVECFLLHAKAQSSGLNLVNATHVFLCEPLINTAIELQAIARVHRIGQHRPTTVWMYLVQDTVEESIYELSVSRRLAHIVQKEKEKENRATETFEVDDRTVKNITETAIDSANSWEMQDAALARLMAGGGEGELVKKDDLWQCLFGNPVTKKDDKNLQAAAESEVARFLRGEAAEQRRAAL
ncbi:SNF2 family N-terminal domain-containing protein [Aspergillus floccosus]